MTYRQFIVTITILFALCLGLSLRSLWNHKHKDTPVVIKVEKPSGKKSIVWSGAKKYAKSQAIR